MERLEFVNDKTTLRNWFRMWLRKLEEIHTAGWKHPHRCPEGRMKTALNLRRCLEAVTARATKLGKIRFANTLIREWAIVENPTVVEIAT